MTRIKAIVTNPLKTKENHNCGECKSSCQSACKTSCTVGNQTCERQTVRVKTSKRDSI